MKHVTRRSFLKHSITASLALGLPGCVNCNPQARASNSEIRIAMIGLGGINTPGGVGGRGRQLIAKIRDIPGVKITALCDLDQTILAHGVGLFKGEKVATYSDPRKVFEDKSIDAVAVALPNHWHALATVWACQAGKDVYCEKPFSYNIWEGRQMAAAARQYNRIVQVGTQNRSSTVLPQAFEYLRSGQIGQIRFAHAIVYRPREDIGKVSAPTPVPATVDYDLWCGPAPKGRLMRKELHYEWHWFWQTGNGEIGNNGVHVIDQCRWGLGQNQIPPRAITIGGRFAFNDGGETPNTTVTLLDYQPAPLICEVRNYRATKDASAIGKFRDRTGGIIIDCEGRYYAGEGTAGTIFDKEGKVIKELKNEGKSAELENAHLTNFFKAVRSRKSSELAAEAMQGHLSAACCHMGNISYRLGKPSAPQAIQESIRANRELAEAFERCREYLSKNGVDLAAAPAALGPWVSYDAGKEQFVNEFAAEANKLSQRDYRKPYVVPKLV